MEKILIAVAITLFLVLVGLLFNLADIEHTNNTKAKILETAKNAYVSGLIDGVSASGKSIEETNIELKKLNDKFIKDLEQKF